MKKRLRKKRHKGEFNYLGFELQAFMDPPLEDDGVDSFVDRLLDWADSHHFGFGGGTDPEHLDYYVCRMIPCRRLPNGKLRFREESCTEEDRRTVENFLLEQPEVIRVATSGLKPSWS